MRASSIRDATPADPVRPARPLRHPTGGRPPPVVTPATLAALQRSAGNRATAGIVAQRTVSVTVRTAEPRSTDPVDKVRIAGRPEGFWAGTTHLLGQAGANQDYRHVIDFDTLKRSHAKSLKGQSVSAADADVTASITAVTRRFPTGYGVPALRVLGRDELRRLEERIKHLLKLEFNLPSNLWLGPSGENRSGGSTAKQSKSKLKSGFPNARGGPRGSKYFKKELTATDLARFQAQNFAARLDLDPAGTATTHSAQLDRFESAFAAAFDKTAKYGDANALAKQWWNTVYVPTWQQGQAGIAAQGQRTAPYLAGRRAGAGARILQRALSVTVRQPPNVAKPIEKIRIADRPGKFWAGVMTYLGNRADGQDVRHIVDFDTIKSSWEKALKGLRIAAANAAVTARWAELGRLFPRSTLKQMRSVSLGNRGLILALERSIRHLMNLEFNNPTNLWIGSSADNRSRGSTARARKRTLKVSDSASKYHDANGALADAPKAAAQQEHWNSRLDLKLPTAMAPLRLWRDAHREHVDRFTGFYETTFSRKSAKYGAAAALRDSFWNDYLAAWRRGFDDRRANRQDDASTDAAYQAGAWDCVAEWGRGYRTYDRDPFNQNPAYDAGRRRALAQYQAGNGDGLAGLPAVGTQVPYLEGHADGCYRAGLRDGLAGGPPVRRVADYLDGHAEGARRRRAQGALKRKSPGGGGRPPKKPRR